MATPKMQHSAKATEQYKAEAKELFGLFGDWFECMVYVMRQRDTLAAQQNANFVWHNTRYECPDEEEWVLISWRGTMYWGYWKWDDNDPTFDSAPVYRAWKYINSLGELETLEEDPEAWGLPESFVPKQEEHHGAS